MKPQRNCRKRRSFSWAVAGKLKSLSKWLKPQRNIRRTENVLVSWDSSRISLRQLKKVSPICCFRYVPSNLTSDHLFTRHHGNLKSVEIRDFNRKTFVRERNFVIKNFQRDLSCKLHRILKFLRIMLRDSFGGGFFVRVDINFPGSWKKFKLLLTEKSLVFSNIRSVS